MIIKDMWYKNAIIYSLDVETFMDGNADGIGDFGGLLKRRNGSDDHIVMWQGGAYEKNWLLIRWSCRDCHRVGHDGCGVNHQA